MNSLLFKSYLWFIAALLLGVFLSETVFISEHKKISHSEESRMFKGYYNLLSEELDKKDLRDWALIIGKWSKNLHCEIHLVEIDSLVLKDKELVNLNKNRFISLEKETGFSFIHKTKDKNYVIIFRNILNEQEETKLNFIESFEQLIVFLSVALAIFFIQYKVIKYMTQLAEVVDDFGKGNLKRRSDINFPSPIKELAIKFNNMADRIQKLIREQKIMTGAVSHELRTPIGRIRFALDLAIEDKNYESRQAILLKMDADVEEMSQVTEEMLMFSSFLNIDLISKGDYFEVPSLVKQALEAIEIFPSDIKIEFNNQIQQPVFGSYADMVIALRNLLKNAQHYAKTKIKITSFTRNEKDIYIIIEDDGSGIPADKMEYIKMPFARADASRNRKTGGCGLGLAIVDRIISAHAGKLLIYNSPLGGARFELKWPLNNPATQKPS